MGLSSVCDACKEHFGRGLYGAGIDQPVAELDVFDGGFFISPVVKAAELEEDVAADESAAGPEGLRLADIVVKIACLMHVVVEQVAKLADKAGIRRGVVVGAKDGIY